MLLSSLILLLTKIYEKGDCSIPM